MSKESKENLIVDVRNETLKGTASCEDTKSKGTYAGTDNVIGTFRETLTEGTVTNLSSTKLNTYQQHVVGAVKSQCVKPNDDVQWRMLK